MPEAGVLINDFPGVVRMRLNTTTPQASMWPELADALGLQCLPLRSKGRTMITPGVFNVEMLAEPLRVTVLGAGGRPAFSFVAPIVFVPPASEDHQRERRELGRSLVRPSEERLYEFQIGRDLVEQLRFELAAGFPYRPGPGFFALHVPGWQLDSPQAGLPPWLTERRQALGTSTWLVDDDGWQEALALAAARSAVRARRAAAQQGDSPAAAAEEAAAATYRAHNSGVVAPPAPALAAGSREWVDEWAPATAVAAMRGAGRGAGRGRGGGGGRGGRGGRGAHGGRL